MLAAIATSILYLGVRHLVLRRKRSFDLACVAIVALIGLTTFVIVVFIIQTGAPRLCRGPASPCPAGAALRCPRVRPASKDPQRTSPHQPACHRACLGSRHAARIPCFGPQNLNSQSYHVSPGCCAPGATNDQWEGFSDGKTVWIGIIAGVGIALITACTFIPWIRHQVRAKQAKLNACAPSCVLKRLGRGLKKQDQPGQIGLTSVVKQKTPSPAAPLRLCRWPHLMGGRLLHCRSTEHKLPEGANGHANGKLGDPEVDPALKAQQILDVPMPGPVTRWCDAFMAKYNAASFPGKTIVTKTCLVLTYVRPAAPLTC